MIFEKYKNKPRRGKIINPLFKISHAVIYHHKNDLCGTLQANTLASVYRRTLTLLLQPTNPPLHHAMAYLKQQQPSPDGPQVNHISWCERASERVSGVRFPLTDIRVAEVLLGVCGEAAAALRCLVQAQGKDQHQPHAHAPGHGDSHVVSLARSQLPALPLRINVLLKVSKGFCWS